ncbi:SH3-containing GRB2-like protein 3-interacting protein 1 [Vanrija pseudolonga]|uniref:SH3-containing GRB2-like protein 3-interacting protein 1 n=1 Tax=Vanrija pseudolonga TaxID=143232 RepID=A0AAF1BTF3_9TREE|nr:SH3-containing GRB2-like protein 3-interacting protein 1 [Vanrija pseudolonga]
MADSLPQDTWINAFGGVPPRTLLSSLQRRQHASQTHVHALAELFRERAAIEQEYAAKLQKLARAAEAGQLNGKGGIEWDRSGGEAKLFNSVLSDINETATAHSSLSQQLKSDFEQPVRDLPNKIEPWRHIGDLESSLDRTLKDQEKVHAKYEKAATKGKSAKTEQLSSELSDLGNSIKSLSPRAWITFQRLDEERLRALKEVVVRFATVRSDAANKEGERAASTLSNLLGWETSDEVITIGHRLGAGGSGSARPSASRPPPPAVNTTATVNKRASVLPGTLPSPGGDFSPRVQRANGSSSNLSTGGGGGFGGLKSMLTRKGTTRQRSGSEATSTRSSRRPTGDMFEPLDESERINDRALDSQSVREYRESPERSTFSDIRESERSHEPASRQTTGPGPVQTPPVDSEGYSIAPADRHRNPWEDPNDLIPTPASGKGLSAAGGVALPSAILAADQRNAQDNQSSTGGSIGGFDGAPRLNLALAPNVIQESEEERQAALAKMQQTLQMAPQAPTRRGTVARGRREVRNTIQASTKENGPIPQQHVKALAQMGEDEERLADTKARLTGAEPTSQLSAPIMDRRRPSLSSVNSSTNPFESPSVTPGVLQKESAFGASPAVNHATDSPASGAPPHAAVAANGAGFGTAAVVGAGALAAGAVGAVGAAAVTAHADNSISGAPLSSEPESLTSPPVPSGIEQAKSPLSVPTSPVTATSHVASPSTAVTSPINALTPHTIAPGLNASLIETVHAWTQKLASQRTVISGEIHVSLLASASRAQPQSGSALHIRLTDFDALESIAPNPAFLAQVPDRPGEYYLNTDAVAQATGSPEEGSKSAGPVLFKYHVLVPAGQETAVAPLVLNPAFQVKDGETRMILQYRSAANAGTISNFRLSAHFPAEPAITSTQSKPLSGSWDSEDGSTDRRITWTPPQTQAGAEGKIIARFITGATNRIPPSSVDAQFVLPDHLLSGIGIEVVSDSPAAVAGWGAFDNVSRATVSGKYVGGIVLNP